MIFFILSELQYYWGGIVGGEGSYYPLKNMKVSKSPNGPLMDLPQGQFQVKAGDNLTFNFNHRWRFHFVTQLFFWYEIFLFIIVDSAYRNQCSYA